MRYESYNIYLRENYLQNKQKKQTNKQQCRRSSKRNVITYVGSNSLSKCMTAEMPFASWLMLQCSSRNRQRKKDTHKHTQLQQTKMQQTTNIAERSTSMSLSHHGAYLCPQTSLFNLHCLIVTYILFCKLLFLWNELTPRQFGLKLLMLIIF